MTTRSILKLTFLVLALSIIFGSRIMYAQSIDEARDAAERARDGENSESFFDSVYAEDLLNTVIDDVLPEFVPFGAGEKLVYSVQYGIVKAGEATLEVRNVAEYDGKACYNIISTARTNDVFSVVYKVRDRFVSLMDTTELVSLRYEKHLREGNFRRDEVVVFDQQNHIASYDNRDVAIAPRTQDVLSAMYYVRTLPLNEGRGVSLANHTGGKNYPLVVKVLGRERIKVDAGTFDCLVVEPFLQGPGLFNQKGRVTVWVTDDRYRIPVLVRSNVAIGAVSAVLKEYDLADKFKDAK